MRTVVVVAVALPVVVLSCAEVNDGEVSAVVDYVESPMTGMEPLEGVLMAEALTGDVVVATIVDLDIQIGTNANPPHVAIEVEKVLRGDVPIGKMWLVWVPWERDENAAPCATSCARTAGGTSPSRRP